MSVNILINRMGKGLLSSKKIVFLISELLRFDEIFQTRRSLEPILIKPAATDRLKGNE